MHSVTTSCAGALLTGAAVAAMLLGPGQSVAQSGSDLAAQVRGCRAVQRDRERLACYDAVFANLDTAPAAAAQPGRAAQAPSAQAAPAAQAVTARPAPPDPPRAAAPAATARTAPPSAAPASEPATPTTVLIVDVNDSIPGAARLVTDTGQVYVQTNSGGRTMLPRVPFEATIEVGTLGSVFLVPEGRRAIRVSPRD